MTDKLSKLGAAAGKADLAAPVEAYGDTAAAIKQALEPFQTLFVGYANGLHGYVCPEWAWRQGGYGPAEPHRCFPDLLTPMARGADELIIKQAIALTKQL